eukprot:scaffold24732_cov122-Isochrysis_galbana.AAC.2
MARTAIRHAIYSAAAAQYRFPVSPHPQEPMRGTHFIVNARELRVVIKVRAVRTHHRRTSPKA